MKIYVWEDIEKVNYYSQKESVGFDENGFEITKELIFPVTALIDSLEPTNDRDFDDAVSCNYYYRNRIGQKYVFKGMTSEQKEKDYCFSISYDTRLLVNMKFKGKKNKKKYSCKFTRMGKKFRRVFRSIT